MKNLFITLAIAVACQTSFAQSPEPAVPVQAENPQASGRVRELGCYVNGLSLGDVIFRFGHEDALWRLRSIGLTSTIGIGWRNPGINANNNTQLGIAIGREWRRPLGKLLFLRYGADINTQNGLQTSESSVGTFRSYSIGLGTNFVLGLGATVKDRFVFGVEILPGIFASYTTGVQTSVGSPNSTINNFNVYFNSRSAATLSAAIRF